jgi:hypothetical protein
VVQWCTGRPPRLVLLLIVVVALSVGTGLSWTSPNLRKWSRKEQTQPPESPSATAIDDDNDDFFERRRRRRRRNTHVHIQQQDRRQALQNLIQKTAAAGAAAITVSLPSPYPHSAMAGNLPLSTGADTSKTGTVETLIPLVKLQASLQEVKSQIINSNPNKIATTTTTTKLQSRGIPTEERSFKRLFDAYSDPVSYKQKFMDQNAFLVYYTKGFDGPNRPTMEEGLPVQQTLQYGLRNDAWVAMEEFLSELEFAQRQQVVSAAGRDEDISYDKQDLLQPLEKVIQAMDGYLSFEPIEDLQQAQQQIAATATSASSTSTVTR